MGEAAQILHLHASCVSFEERGLLIMGPSGAGKSALALQLMAYGATLVADDQVIVKASGDALIAHRPPGLPELIEARGVGLLRAKCRDQAEIHLIVELTEEYGQRLPPQRHLTLLSKAVEVVSAPMSCHLGAAVVQYLRAGREH